MNLLGHGDDRGGGAQVRDDRRGYDVHGDHDDRGIPNGTDRLVLRPAHLDRRVPDRRRGIQNAGVAWAGMEGMVRDGADRGGTIHDAEAEVEVEVEGKVRDDEDQEGTVHEVEVEVEAEGGSANPLEGARRHHPPVGAYSE